MGSQWEDMRLHLLPRREEAVECLLGEVLGWSPAPSHRILWVSWATVFRLFPHEAAVQSSLLSWYCLPPPLFIFTEVNWYLENAHVITVCGTVGLQSRLSSHAFSLQHLPQPTVELQLSWRNCAQDSAPDCWALSFLRTASSSYAWRLSLNFMVWNFMLHVAHAFYCWFTLHCEMPRSTYLSHPNRHSCFFLLQLL